MLRFLGRHYVTQNHSKIRHKNHSHSIDRFSNVIVYRHSCVVASVTLWEAELETDQSRIIRTVCGCEKLFFSAKREVFECLMLAHQKKYVSLRQQKKRKHAQH